MENFRNLSYGFLFYCSFRFSYTKKRRKLIKQQNYSEEKELKKFYAENLFRNKYGFKSELSTIFSNLLINFNEKLFEDFDSEKIKHIRNAQSNLCNTMPSCDYDVKVTFYIGLMDKDDLSYKFSKQDAIKKVISVLENCTITEAQGSYKKNNKSLLIDTLVVTKFFKKFDSNNLHEKVKELKSIFNQESIITEISKNNTIYFNNESKETTEYIENIMKEYNFDWDTAYKAYESGMF